MGTTPGFLLDRSSNFHQVKRAWRLSNSQAPMLPTAKPRTSLAGCGAWTARCFKSSRSIARIWVVRCVGFRSRICSCVHATAAPITKMDRAPPGHRSAGCSSTATGWKRERCSSGLVKYRRPDSGPVSSQGAGRALHRESRQLVRPATTARKDSQGNAGASCSTADRKLVLRLW